MMNMSYEQMQAEIERLERVNANLKAAKAKNGMRVSEKGAVSVYSIGRFPVTLYAEQWRKLLAMASEIEAFIVANESALAKKSSKSEADVN